jgi:iron complex outermembrane receptor protein
MVAGLLLVCGLSVQAAEPTAVPTEASFLDDLPVVLSVSRLAQRLDETPGAVTVIDREMIRRSGAREVAELLRLVPGFIVSHFDGGARPFATYHADYDAYNRRLQVYIDGRSVYSGLVLGNAAYGMMGVVLDDIERIEVLRGSNSAAYGANAFLGVVNIVTRHADDARGSRVSVAAGQQGVRDASARIGWGDLDRAFRLTAAQREDDGFGGPDDDKRVRQLHFRGDLRPSGRDELTLTAGLAEFGWGAPWGGIVPRRTETWRNAYAHAQWRRQLDAGDELRVSAVLDQEVYDDFYPSIPADGETRRLNLDIQHTFAAGPALRVVWGGEYRQEGIESKYLFASDPEQSNRLWRLFGNAEWRPRPEWIVNFGGLWEHDGFAGDHLAPRLMVNHHLAPDHTLRIGTTRAYRLPSQMEAKGDWRWPQYGVHLINASGQAEPERIDVREVGYLGRLRGIGVSLDLRLFDEHMDSMLSTVGSMPKDFVNNDANSQHGWEMQLRWQPGRDTEIMLNHTDLRLEPGATSTAPQDKYRAPRHISSLAVFQRLPEGWDLSLMWSRVGTMYYVRQSEPVPAYDQLDLRLARRFQLGGADAEAALVVQAADGGHVEFTPAYRLDRRAFVTLSLEY